MVWFWVGIGVLAFFLVLAILGHIYVVRTYIPHAVRIFQEKPPFKFPFGKPDPSAENVRFPTSDNLTLCGCYLKGAGPRQGVVLFGIEFGSNRWSCVPYCDFLREQGFDIFAFEVRNQGESDAMPGYEPLQWVTNYEVEDFRAALTYLKSRPDADPRGIGFFGISKGGSAGLLAAVGDPFVRCFLTDGIFAAHTTMVPYMQKWILIYCRSSRIALAVPGWYYRKLGLIALNIAEKQRRCHFPHLEHVIQKLAPRPFFMIQGGGDNYIKPEMGRALFDLAGQPKQFWLVENAKHNQAFHLANGEYKRKVLAFFLEHLAGVSITLPAQPAIAPAAQTAGNGTSLRERGTPLAEREGYKAPASAPR